MLANCRAINLMSFQKRDYMKRPYVLFANNALAIFLSVVCHLPIAWADATYAHIELLEGTVSIIDSKGQARIPHIGDPIEVGETIVTGRNGELQARTEDHGYVSFRSNTKMKIESYLANGGKEDNVVVSLLYGTLRSITGWIGKNNPSQYAIRTPSATIGIRGTDHEPHVILPSENGEKTIAPPGTYEKVNEGSTVVKNKSGEIVVNAKQAAFAPHDSKSAPKVLERIPEIYKATSNEARIDARSKELAKEMAEKLQQKQKEVLEKKEASEKKEVHKKAAEKKRHPPPEK